MATLLGGALLLSEWLTENPPVETHAAEGGVHHGGHGDTTFLDLQSTIAIVTMLITVTIVFEKAKHRLEHNVPPMMSAVLSALFGELTVLGFIALYAFFMLQTGVIPAVSILVYGDSEHMLHLFEEIHFLLFFVMVIFLMQAFALVRALMAVEQAWHPCTHPHTPFFRRGLTASRPRPHTASARTLTRPHPHPPTRTLTSLRCGWTVSRPSASTAKAQSPRSRRCSRRAGRRASTAAGGAACGRCGRTAYRRRKKRCATP